MEYRTRSTEETRSLGGKLAQEFHPGMLVTFQGELGAGKTTLIQGILESLGAERPFVSPTFVLMKEYDLKVPSKTGIQRIYHADAYRVGASDFTKLGFAEWCADNKGIVLLEWPERVTEILPEQRTRIILKSLSETERELFVEEI